MAQKKITATLTQGSNVVTCGPNDDLSALVPPARLVLTGADQTSAAAKTTMPIQSFALVGGVWTINLAANFGNPSLGAVPAKIHLSFTPSGFPLFDTNDTAAKPLLNDSADAAEALAAASLIRYPSLSIVGALDPTGLSQSSSAIGNALDKGGSLFLQEGTYWVEGNIGGAYRTTICGEGAGAMTKQGHTMQGTVLFTKSTTANMLSFSSKGCNLRDITLLNLATQTPTAGAGVAFVDHTGGHLTRVNIVNFYDAFTVQNGFYYTFTDCGFYDPVHTGGYIQDIANADDGDQSFVGCTWSSLARAASPLAALLISSGGGTRIVSGKVNAIATAKWQNGFLLLIAQNAVTSDFLLGGKTSIENVAGYAVVSRQATAYNGGQYNLIDITDTEVGYSGGGFDIDASSSSVLANNKFISLDDASIVYRSNYGAIGRNYHTGVPVLIRMAASQSGNASTCVRIAEQSPSDPHGTYFQNTVGAQVQADHTSIQQIPFLSQTPLVDFILHRIGLPEYNSAEVALTITGTVSNAGSFVLTQRRHIYRDNSISYVRALGPDLASGTGASKITVKWDAATLGGGVLVRISTTGGIPTQNSNARISVNGQLSLFAFDGAPDSQSGTIVDATSFS